MPRRARGWPRDHPFRGGGVAHCGGTGRAAPRSARRGARHSAVADTQELLAVEPDRLALERSSVFVDRDLGDSIETDM